MQLKSCDFKRGDVYVSYQWKFHSTYMTWCSVEEWGPVNHASHQVLCWYMDTPPRRARFPLPPVILISRQQGAELGHPHYRTLQIRSFSAAFIKFCKWYHLDEPFCKTCGHLCTLHAHPNTHKHTRARVERQMCEEEAKVSVMDRREGWCSSPASFLLYLSHWPVVVASRPCCVHGEWPDLILDCLAVSGGVEGWGFPTWHLSNSGRSSTGKPIMALVGLDCSLEPTKNRRAQQTCTAKHHHSGSFVTYRPGLHLCLVPRLEIPNNIIRQSN